MARPWQVVDRFSGGGTVALVAAVAARRLCDAVAAAAVALARAHVAWRNVGGP
jgi:hypothetical protein